MVKDELDRAVKERQELLDQINQIDQVKQQKLQELLRLDGEVRVLYRLKEKEDVQP